MQSTANEHDERLMELCLQASTEQDSKKLIELVGEINRLLEAKYKSLAAGSATEPQHTPPR
jgi:hypothetical protein